jgi:[acyl-carrier-protein] S-malonyltransferase
LTTIKDLDPRKTAFVFPGQGSQTVGMGRDLANGFAAARGVFSRADEILGFGLSEIMWNGPVEALNDTVNTQPALFVHSLASYAVFTELFPGFRPALLAGHSLGELSALTAGEALAYSEAVRLVRRRGELMKQAGELHRGGMAAVLNLDIAVLEGICAEASTATEPVQVANDNSPGQIVISGANVAVERAMEMAKAAGARRVIPLAVSIAAHSKLMQPIQDEWNQAVAKAGLRDSKIPLIGNVEAATISSAAELAGDIQRQMQSRVRWTETIQVAGQAGVDTFVEVGTGSVLLGLVKRIAVNSKGYPLGTAADFAAFQAGGEAAAEPAV